MMSYSLTKTTTTTTKEEEMMKGGWRSTIRNKNEELMVLAGREVVEEFAEGLGSCDQVRESP